MATRHTLTRSNLQRLVENRIGTYVLYHSRKGPPRYVGRSGDLRDRILDYVDDYQVFTFEYHPNITEAYQHEVNLYHDHGGKEELDNTRHPQRPHTNVKCHRCDVHG